MNPTKLAESLCAEFVIQHRAGGADVDATYLATIIRKELTRAKVQWAYYTNGGKTIRTTPDKQYAEQNADGFTWSNPRIRRCAIVELA